MRYVGLVLLSAFLAFGVASHVQAQDGTADRAAVRDPGEILGGARHSKAKVERYARSKDSTNVIMRTIPIYYEMAPRRNIAPDVLVAQAMVETGYGHYGGDSEPWNMAGVKKGDATGDEPRDFEKPATARAGVRMHVNRMAAYTRARSLSARPTTASTWPGKRSRTGGTGCGTSASSAASGPPTLPTTTRSGPSSTA